MTARVSSLSHTADVGFEVEASTLGELFVGAAMGLVAALTEEEPGEVAPGEETPGEGEGQAPPRAEAGETTWTLARPDLERLLVAWLRELLHQALSRGALPHRVDVRFTGETSLEASIRWASPDGTPGIVREVKGVTYHGLSVREDGGRWSARVVLDV